MTGSSDRDTASDPNRIRTGVTAVRGDSGTPIRREERLGALFLRSLGCDECVPEAVVAGVRSQFVATRPSPNVRYACA